MNFKKFWKTSPAAFVLKNIIVAVIITAIIAAIALIWLAKYTRHGDEVTVPYLNGMYIEEAEIIAQNEGLNIVVIDSTYSRKVDLGTIVEQNPRADSHAKRGRDIYVIVNAKAVRQVVIPDLRDVSYRQAEASLKVIGIEVDNVEYEPSEFRDLVLDIRQADNSIAPGARLKEGSKVTLVVGFGKGTEQVEIPDLIGKNIEEMRQALLAARLIPGAINYDEPLTDDNREMFVVYAQSHRAGETILEGSRVDVQMTTSLEKVATAQDASSEEDFF